MKILSGFGCRSPVAFGRRFWHRSARCRRALRHQHGCGCSSVVEHDLAKVGVEGSNPFARSSFWPAPPIAPSDMRPFARRFWADAAKAPENARSPDAPFLIAPLRQALLNPTIRNLAARCQRPSFAKTCPLKNRGHGERRALAAPMARLQKKMQAAGTTGSAETSRHSPRDGFNGCFAFSPVRRAFWPPYALDASASARISASGYQDHAT